MRYKNIFRFILFLLLINGALPAGNGDGECKKTDLSKWDIKASICLPSGITVKEVNYSLTVGDVSYFKKAELISKENIDFEAIAKIKPTFAMQISNSKADLKGLEKEIRENDVNKLTGFIKKTESLLFYESEVMRKKEYHFVMNVTVNGNTVSFEDVKGENFTKKQVEAMITVVETLRKN